MKAHARWQLARLSAGAVLALLAFGFAAPSKARAECGSYVIVGGQGNPEPGQLRHVAFTSASFGIALIVAFGAAAFLRSGPSPRLWGWVVSLALTVTAAVAASAVAYRTRDLAGVEFAALMLLFTPVWATATTLSARGSARVFVVSSALTWTIFLGAVLVYTANHLH